MKRFRWFQWSLVGILVLFGSILCLVGIKAYSRTTGNTGLDMAKIHLLRQEKNSKK